MTAPHPLRLLAAIGLLPLLAGCFEAPDGSRPTVTVLSPDEGQVGVPGEATALRARVDDGADPLVRVSVRVTSDLDGELCLRAPGTTGLVSCEAVLSEGLHTLRFVARDDAGKTGGASVPHLVPATSSLDVDGDGVSADEGDCDDADVGVYPGATERPNGVDDDCDGVIDEGTAAYDDDRDGFSEDEGDCDDADAGVYPGAPERFNAQDDDCDGLIDEGTDTDDDFDGFTEEDGDCDDADAGAFPGAEEIVNGRDDDCDGAIDEGTPVTDDDGDGYAEVDGDCDDADPAVNPDAVERADGVDNDCDGEVDEVDGTWSGTLEVVIEAVDESGDSGAPDSGAPDSGSSDSGSSDSGSSDSGSSDSGSSDSGAADTGAPSVGAPGTCAGPFSLVVAADRASVISGSGDCAAGVLEALSFSGETVVGGVFEGDVSATAFGSLAVTLPWAATVVGDDVSGSFSGDVSDGEATWRVSGTLTGTR